jgi:hypothetical protein
MLSVAFTAATTVLFGQNIGINDDGSNPDPSAALDIKSTDRGLLIPRVAINDVNNASPVTAPVEGLLVYNETGTEPVGFYYWDSTKWVKLNTGASSGPWDRTAPNVYLVDNTDSVGIGTNTPEAKLHINSRSANTSLLIEGNSMQSNDKPVILVQDNTGTEFFLIHADSPNNLFIGKSAGVNNDVTTASVFEGERNTFIGSQTGYNNTTGSSNTALGYQSLMSSTTSNSNTAIGSWVLKNNLSGSENTGLGASALRDNTNGLRNTAIGFGAILTNTTGNDNTSIGFISSSGLSSGTGNVAIGSKTLASNSNTNYCVAIGFEALYNAYNGVAGNPNIAIGSFALKGSSTPANNSGGENTAIGTYGLTNNTLGSNNTSIGHNSMYSNTSACNNVAIGNNALYSQSYNNGGGVWVSDNIAIGNQALYSNQPTSSANGYRNVAIGSLSMRNNTTGYHNTAVGYQALMSNTTAIRNTALGGFTLANNTTGEMNTALGYLALAANTTGSYNVAVGVDVLRAGNSGSYNVGIGYLSLYNNNGGNNNIGIGNESLRSNITGNYNLGIGNKSLESNTTGNYNISIGTRALAHNSIGQNNVSIGSASMRDNISGCKSVAIGDSVLYSMDFDNANAEWNSYNVGIGYYSLHNLNPTATNNGVRNTSIGSFALYQSTTGRYNSCVGYSALDKLTSATGNTSFGYAAGNTVTTGDYNTFLGYATDISAATYTNCVAIGGNGNLGIGASNRVRIGNASITSIGGQVGWTTVSDARLKTNVTEDVTGLNFIMKLRPVTYHYKTDLYNKHFNLEDTVDYPEKNDIEKMKFSGFLAQEVEAAAKSAGYDFSGVDRPGNENDIYGLRYSEFVVPMVKAMQEQQQMIEDLQKKVKEQEDIITRLAQLEKEMQLLKNSAHAESK